MAPVKINFVAMYCSCVIIPACRCRPKRLRFIIGVVAVAHVVGLRHRGGVVDGRAMGKGKMISGWLNIIVIGAFV